MNGREEAVIIGMAGRFPGADSVRELWANLVAGVESIRAFSDVELDAAGVDRATRDDPGYVPAGAPLADADCFDAPFFAIQRREAELMDPQHRIFLEAAWAALEDAGHDPAAFGGRIGVFGGVAPNTYRSVVLDTRPDILRITGRYPLLLATEREYAVTRVAFKLDLTGPAISVNTACSTSGVALHLAVGSVLSGECDMALVGGARVAVPLTAGYPYQEDGILSPDGHCRAFAADGRGTVVGSGVGMIVIRRMSDAIADGDTIRAVVRATAINNDGADKLGYTAPSAAGQAEVIREALDLAGVDASTISYVEAHGTGTAIGDPIEIAGLTEAFRQDTTDRVYCHLGSIKTNIGHLDAGAGVAGIIKTVMAMQHGVIPPSLNFDRPNPQIDFDSTPFVVADSAIPWERTGRLPRRAGVSSFGLGGTNFHAVLEEGPIVPERPSARSLHVLPISGRTPEAADAAIDRMIAHIGASPSIDLADAAHTLAIGRRAFDHRRAIVARREGDDLFLHATSVREPVVARETLFMFPGGGAQHVGMARSLFLDNASFKARVEDLLRTSVGGDAERILALVASGDADELDRPAAALPALFAVECALTERLIAEGVRPDLVIGHSMGEYTAAAVAGVMSYEDAARIVAKRAELFETLDPGAMISVLIPETEMARRLTPDLSIAVVNQSDSCVVAGSIEAIEALADDLTADGIESRRIGISVAAHSHLVEPILERFGAFVDTIDLREPEIPLVSNLTGAIAAPGTLTQPGYWISHLRHTVRFVDGLGAALGGLPKVAIEVGPGNTLSGFARRNPGRVDGQVVIATQPHRDEATQADVALEAALAQVWAAGGPVDLATRYTGEDRRRIPLPTYPFERIRHWIEPAIRGEASVPAREPVAQVEEGASEPSIAERVTATLSALSGLRVDELDPRASFLELGFDSLFMTQAAAALGSELGVRISFRQMFEETPTIEALVRLLVDRVEPAALSPTASIATSAGPSPTPTAATSAPVSTGPWRAPDRDADELTAEQRRHVDALIDRLTTASPSSKAETDRHRPHLADPRTVSGFRRAWKELVYPVVVERSAGARVWDIDGNEYVDIAMGFGVNLFGHSPEFVIEAVRSQLERGIEIGPQTPLAHEASELIARMTGHQRVAFCNTGSEAVLAAMRLSRLVTRRPKIVTFTNDYHGLFDEVLARGVVVDGERRSIPLAPGIPRHAAADLVVLDYGDEASLRWVEENAGDVAAVLVEPVQSRNPAFQPIEFLRSLRRLTTERGIALIFDEMITGFRAHPGGVQAMYDIRADLATYGKVAGGGFPIGVVAGDARFMDGLDGGEWRYGDHSIPEADVTWFAGTFVRHPIALAASIAALRHMEAAGPELQHELNTRTSALVARVNKGMESLRAPIRVEHFASLFLTRFLRDHRNASLFWFHLRDAGIHVTEGRASFLSTAHTDADLDRIERAFLGAAEAMLDVGLLTPAGPTRFPLTGGQSEIWTASRLAPAANASYNLSNTLAIDGEIDPDILSLAVARLVERHDALRLRFDPDGRMQTGDAQPADVQVVDLSGDPHADRTLDALRADDVTEPFDLAGEGALHRVTLVLMPSPPHHLFLTVHHAIVDGWSSGTLLRELTALYEEARGGRVADLGPAMQYAEFAEDERALRASAEWPDHLAHWSAVVRDWPVTDLPADRPRPVRREFAAERFETRLEPEVERRLRQVATRSGTTPFVVLLAAFQYLLARLSRRDDVGIGVSIAGHTRYPNRHLVGHCVNVVPFRSRVMPGGTFEKLLADTRGAFLDAYDHHVVSLGEIITHAAVPRHPSRNPLASIVFNMDSPSSVLPWPGGKATPGSNPRTYEMSDVFLNIVPTADGLVIECTYDTSLFDRPMIEGHIDAWLRLVDSVTQDPTLLIEVEVQEEPSAGGSAGGRTHVPLNNDLERQVARMWSELLEVDVTSAAENLFELGGNSLDLIRFHTRVHERYGVAPAIGDLFGSPTVGAVADAVAGAILDAEFDGDASNVLGGSAG